MNAILTHIIKTEYLCSYLCASVYEPVNLPVLLRVSVYNNLFIIDILHLVYVLPSLVATITVLSHVMDHQEKKNVFKRIQEKKCINFHCWFCCTLWYSKAFQTNIYFMLCIKHRYIIQLLVFIKAYLISLFTYRNI